MTINFKTLPAGTKINRQTFHGEVEVYTVVANDGVKITLTNPEAGNVHGNYNASAKTTTFKVTSPTLAARFKNATVEA